VLPYSISRRGQLPVLPTPLIKGQANATTATKLAPLSSRKLIDVLSRVVTRDSRLLSEDPTGSYAGLCSSHVIFLDLLVIALGIAHIPAAGAIHGGPRPLFWLEHSLPHRPSALPEPELPRAMREPN
jgi:hypothetical protein